MSEFAPVAERIDALFAQRWPRGNRTANAIVADFVSRAVGRSIDRQYIYRLRTGRVRRVDVPVLEAIAEFFGSGLDYFSGAGRDDPTVATLESVMEETGFQLAGLRSRKSLTPEAAEMVANLMRQARQVIDEDKRNR